MTTPSSRTPGAGRTADSVVPRHAQAMPGDVGTRPSGSPPRSRDDVQSRRDMASALLSGLGIAAVAGFAPKAAAQGIDNNVGKAVQALLDPHGTDIAWVDTVLGKPPQPTPALLGPPRQGDLAITTPSPISGPTVVIAKGCLTPGDGGGGIFFWVPGPPVGPGGTDDGGTFIVPNANGTGQVKATGGGWQRLYAGPLNVKWFGAVRNADFNDPIADDWDALNNAINASVAIGNRHLLLHPNSRLPPQVPAVYLPPGAYMVTRHISLNAPGLKLFGDGRATTRLLVTAMPPVPPNIENGMMGGTPSALIGMDAIWTEVRGITIEPLTTDFNFKWSGFSFTKGTCVVDDVAIGECYCGMYLDATGATAGPTPQNHRSERMRLAGRARRDQQILVRWNRFFLAVLSE
jgi:hypothetical protein